MRRHKVVGFSLVTAAVLGSLALAQAWRPGSPSLDRAPLRRTLPAAVSRVGGGAGGDPWALFDGDLQRGWTVGDGEPSRFRIELDRPRPLAAVGVFGPAGGHLTISVERDGAWVPAQEMELDPSSRGWRRFTAESPFTARTLLVDWQPAAPGAALPEIELWSAGSSDPSRIFRARPAAGAITAGAEAVFHVRLDRDPGTFQRAFLAYELDGLPDWSSAVRAINGLPAQGGFAAQAVAGAGLQLEEINPAWLRRGRNEVRFFPAAREDLPPAAVAGLRERALSGTGTERDAEILPYAVRNLRLVLMADDGHPLVSDALLAAPAPSSLAASLIDGNPGTAWDGAEAVELPLRHASQPWALDLVTSGRPSGELVVEGVLSGGGTEVLARVDLSDLTDRSDQSELSGRHRLALDEDLPAVSALRLAWTGGRGGAIVEADLLASPMRQGTEPRLQLTRPVSGDPGAAGVDLRGFAEGRPVGLLIDGLPVAAALTPEDGAFEVFVPRPAAPGVWDVALTLVYPDGSRLTRTVRLVAEEPGEGDSGQESAEAEVSPGEAKSLALGRARLDVPADALGRKVALSMKALAARELPALDTGMTNVTPSRGGFRMGPHGLRFRRPVRLTLPYDPQLIPPGLSENDIQTFFFDEESGRWRPIERIAVEAGRQTVASATDHFTDFINATLTVPDEPSGASFSPNSVRSLGTPDPTSGITLIAPPEGGPQGDAQLAFPLELPPGRQGMEPSLSVDYSSGSGNGWLGEGWDLRLPAIEVSTLHGVPRYAPDVETETYLLDGEQLAPTADRTAPVSRSPDRRFVQRSEGEFLRIVRRGSSPDSYFWEVTDKEGTRWIYGQTAQARLADVQAPHNIFRWSLERIVDLHGNTVEYSYVTDGPSPGEGGEPWTQIYPARIDYTGGRGPAFYQVRFVLDDLEGGERPDRMSSGLSGFKTVTRRRLARVDVLAGGELVRRYRLDYREGEFRKSLLAAISVTGEDGETELYRHGFDYFGMPRAGADDGYAGFSAAAAWSGIGGGRDATATSCFAAGAHAFVGFAPNPACQGHAGIQGGFSAGETSTSALFLDVNGDGLTDRLADDGRIDLNAYDTATGATGFRPGWLDGVDGSLAHTDESSFDVALGVHAPGEAAGADVSWVWSHGNDDRGVADVNGDGLPDLLSTGGVRFNDGRAFGPMAPAWNGPGLDLTVPGEESELKGALPLSDALRALELPYDGTVSLGGAVQKKQAGGSDGVVAEIHLGGRRIWRRAFAPDEVAPCTPGPGDSCGGGLSFDVQAGERLYFLAHAIDDTEADSLFWAPRITYEGRDPEALEPWGAPVYVFDAADDFRLAGPPGGAWAAPADGAVRVLGAILKQPTSDDVTVTVRKNGAVVHSLALAAADAGSFDAAVDMPVARQDILTFEVRSDSQIDPARVAWRPIVAFDPSDWPQGVAEPEDAPAQVAYQVHRLLPLDRPTVSWEAPEAGTYTFHLAWQDTGPFSLRRAPVTLFAQSLHRLLGKSVVPVGEGSAGLAVTADLAAGERVTFTAVLGASGDAGSFAVLHGLQTLPANVRLADPEASGSVLSGGWHGWSYGEWNGAESFRESRLAPDSRDFVAAVPQWQGSRELAQPLWRAGGFDLYLASGEVKPSRRGTNVTAELRRANGGGGGGSGPGLLRKTYGRTEAVGANVGPAGLTVASGYSEVQLDLLDLNGDLRADHIGQGAAGFSTGNGFGAFTAVPGLDAVRHQDDFNASAALSIGLHYTQKDGQGNPRAVRSTMPSAGATTAVSRTRDDLVDVNGDGLPDRVSLGVGSDVLAVRLNLGYRFGAPEAWPLPRWGDVSRCREAVDLFGLTGLDTLDSIALTRSAAYNLGAAFGPIGGGVGVTLSRTLTSLVDVNGDGLADHVAKDGGEDFLRVKLNRGDGWDPEQRWYLEDAGWPVTSGDAYNPGGVFQCVDGLELNGNIDGNGSIGAPICIPLVPPIPIAGLQIEVSAQASGGDGGLQLSFTDIDGDGRPDHVLKQKGDGTVWVKRNQADKVNLLSTVHGPLGGSIALDYRRQGNRVDHSDPEHRIDMPSGQWVLASSTVDDGRGSSYRTAWDYFNDSFYDRAERESYGYARVRTIRPDGSTIDEHYHNQDLYRRHLPVKTVVADASGALFQVETRRWELRPVGGRGDAFFPALAEQSTFLYEGTTAFYEGNTESEGAAPKSTTETFDYDAQGNVIRAADAADEGSGDDTVTTIAWHVDPATHVMEPEHLEVRDGEGRLLRERRGSFDDLGNLERLESTLIGGRDPSSGAPYAGTNNPVWTFSYDELGNLATSTDPAGYRRTFSYDPETGTWPIQVTDSFGYTWQTAYDLKHGQVTETVDPNRQSIRRTYDGFGRLAAVFAPGDPAGAPSLSFDYDPAARPAWAVAHHKDVTRPGDPIDASAFVDGLGRTIQTQNDTEIDLGSGTSTRTGTQVSGRLEFDVLGRVASTGQPVVSDGPASRFVDVPLTRPTVYRYDVLDRVRSVRFPHGAETRIDHGFATFDGATRLLTTRTDPNGRTARIYLDVQGEALAVEQPATGSRPARITRYAYNALSEITAVTDPLGFVTRLEYDTLGRNTVLDNPDAGRTEMRWEVGGDLGARITANLAARGQQIRFHNNFHRIERIDYPEMPDAVYTYGGPGAPENRVGRIATLTDESGVEELSYGPLGEVVRTVKTATALNGFSPKGPYTTTFAFDSLGRLLSMSYPDGEVMTWDYDVGGRVKSLSGVLRGVRTDYLAHVGYDEFGARARRIFGNGVETRETFDPNSRELERLQTADRGGRALQNLRYTRDKAGIVQSLRNDVPIVGPSLAGGPMTQSFVYDDLYQLVGAEGSYTAAPNQRSTYDVSLAYNLAGDITAKRQVHEVAHGGGKPHLQKKTSYDWTYTYGGAHPHAPVHLGERSFRYDANGNQTGWDHDQNGTRRNNTWDEENRLKAVADNGQTTRFLYDTSGLRTAKAGPHGETLYINRWYSVRNGALGSKHVFADDTRIASTVTQTVVDGTTGPVETKLYYYHGDQLGSSNFITDAGGEVFQHLEYFPFGEIWVDERTETQRTPYLFSGKELDEETGLSYFGARYYDARQGQWISADPILDRMLDTGRLTEPDLSFSPFWMGGQTYVYTANNPTNLTDPTGLANGKPPGYKSPKDKLKKKQKKHQHMFAKPAYVKLKGALPGKKKIAPLVQDGQIQSTFATISKNARRLERVDAQLKRAYLDTGSGTNATTRAYVHGEGRSTDDAGHVIARRLGGPGNDNDYIFPQTPSINRGAFRMFEERIYNAVKQHGAADVSLVFSYVSTTARRPISVVYSVKVRNTAGKVVDTFSETFINP